MRINNVNVQRDIFHTICGAADAVDSDGDDDVGGGGTNAFYVLPGMSVMDGRDHRFYQVTFKGTLSCIVSHGKIIWGLQVFPGKIHKQKEISFLHGQ